MSKTTDTCGKVLSSLEHENIRNLKDEIVLVRYLAYLRLDESSLKRKRQREGGKKKTRLSKGLHHGNYAPVSKDTLRYPWQRQDERDNHSVMSIGTSAHTRIHITYT